MNCWAAREEPWHSTELGLQQWYGSTVATMLKLELQPLSSHKSAHAHLDPNYQSNLPDPERSANHLKVAQVVFKLN